MTQFSQGENLDFLKTVFTREKTACGQVTAFFTKLKIFTILCQRVISRFSSVWFIQDVPVLMGAILEAFFGLGFFFSLPAQVLL